MSTQTIRHIAGFATALIFATGLSACGGDDPAPRQPGVVVTPPPPPPPPPPPLTGDASEFGSGFATAFRADADAQPVDPVQGDIIAVTKFGDPTDIPNP